MTRRIAPSGSPPAWWFDEGDAEVQLTPGAPWIPLQASVEAYDGRTVHLRLNESEPIAAAYLNGRWSFLREGGAW